MIRINLIRDLAVAAPEPSSTAPLLLAVVAVAALAVVDVTLASRLANLTEGRDALRLEIAREESVIVRERSRRRPVPAAAAKSVRSTAAGQRLRHVATAVPNGVWLTAYSERQGEVAMHGVASTDEAARVFVDNLLATTAFVAVEITETSRAVAAGDGGRADGASTFRLKAASAESETADGGGHLR